ncbi:hypothetical protein A3Q56_03548 [Intoshia linei]|uniref:Uncharacterized protein n=1 Tax=Intoshia linei TaxID=1819745 RepID=A0A177B3I0_9BILA|nr:hypothetical protein A3Q56_03548 [Intoshia linei]
MNINQSRLSDDNDSYPNVALSLLVTTVESAYIDHGYSDHPLIMIKIKNPVYFDQNV